MVKPEALYKAELLEVIAKVESDYRDELDVNKEKLLPLIASLSVELKSAQTQIQKERTAQAKFEKELADITQELLGDFTEDNSAPIENGVSV